jgi:hypothetical protein
MAPKSRMYRFDLCDGHGCETRLVAAQSRDDAQNLIDATKSPYQKAQNFEHLGWCPVQARPDEDERGVAFDVSVKGKNVEFTQTHESYAHLTKLAAKDVKKVREGLD